MLLVFCNVPLDESDRCNSPASMLDSRKELPLKQDEYLPGAILSGGGYATQLASYHKTHRRQD